ncbi:MAG: hybrid sensor histidine kinase/response regulator [Thermoanaerobaculia bacterium]
MVESVSDYAIVMLNPDGNVVSWNTGAERIKGFTADEIVGQHFSRFYPPDDVASGKPQRDLDVAASSGRFEDEGWRTRKDGSTFLANVVITAIRDQAGDLRGFAKLTRDLTARQRIETEMTNAKAAAEKANLAKSDFLSSMSHELRSPLNAILGFAQLMDSESPPPTVSQKESIVQILNAGWYLLELINEILDLAVIESGKLSMSQEPISVAEVMVECQAMIEPQAQRRGIRMTFPRFDVPTYVRADRTRLKQVIINLLSNAIKYNAEGGTVVIDCCGDHTPGRVRISVTDTGNGLSSEQMTQLFQPFNRLGQEANAEQGTGIGLVVSKRLMELMDGVVGVESKVGSGSVFWIELNSTSLLPASKFDHIEIAKPLLARAALRTLLYVEDNPANLRLVERLIARRPDMRLLSAIDGTTGVELARSAKPEVILMDINLPGISGIDAMKILRGDASTAHIPVVALSANAVPHDVQKGLEAGFFRYLTKPIKVAEFMETISAAFDFVDKGAGVN